MKNRQNFIIEKINGKKPAVVIQSKKIKDNSNRLKGSGK